MDWDSTKGIMTALGIGLLIGAIRERNSAAPMAGLRTHALVAARTESHITSTAKNDHAYGRIFPHFIERANQLQNSLGTKCITHFRTIDRNFCNSIRGGLVNDIFKLA